jgi:light-regulated signal transduction histidine kinase (bacteriophytochrome)
LITASPKELETVYSFFEEVELPDCFSNIGIILVKEFVEKQGGTICIESTVCKGSSFFFTLPVTSGKNN